MRWHVRAVAPVKDGLPRELLLLARSAVLSRSFSVLQRPPPNYAGHVPLTKLERAGLAVGSAVASFFNPRRADLIAALGEATATPYFIHRLHRAMLLSPIGRRILRDRPRMTSATLSMPHLRSLAANTVGATYAAWLDREGVSPDTRDAVKYIDNEEAAYVMQRYRESHDFYHAITGLPIFVEGEVALKAWEWANTALPMAGLSMFAALRMTKAERHRFRTIYLPWALRNGWMAEECINVYWEEQLERDVAELRLDLGIEMPPLDLRDERQRLRQERRRKKQLELDENNTLV